MMEDWQKHRRGLILIFVFCMAATLSFLSTGHPDHSSAVSTAGFNPGNIISDAVMSNYNSMSAAEIQSFLTSKNSCQNTNEAYYRQLEAQYPNLDWHFENGHFVCLSEERFGDTWTEIGTGQTAAEIIYQAAQDYKINPQVLLVLLEKEQSLITDTFPNSKQYRSATGYGCPDTAACSSKYYGFKNQIRNAAALFRNVLDNGYSVYPERTPGVYVGYNPNAACGRSEVFIENRATAALYRYTPYQPNAAALNAGYGTGDSCSAYGNRNFYLYFHDWFGDLQAKVDGEPVVIPDGEYSFVSQTSIKRSLGSSAANVELAALDALDDTQRWDLRRDTETGLYEITNVATGEYLSISNSEATLRENIILQDETPTCAKQWRIYHTADNYLTFESACMPGLVVDVDEASNRVGTNIQLWIANGCLAQKWKLYPGQTIAPGVYTVAAKNDSEKNIDISGGNSRNGTNIQLWERNGEWPQRWQLAYDAKTSTYTFTNPASGRLLDLSAANTAIGTNIQIWQNTYACAQRWKIVETPDQHYTLISDCSEARTLDLADGKTINGTNIRLWEANNADAQKWAFYSEQVIADGVYTISAKNDLDENVDVSGGVDANGTNIQLWERNGEWPQDWIFKYDAATGAYTITNVGSGRRLLSVKNNQMAIGTNVHLWQANNSCGQRWIIRKTPDGYYNLISACNPDRALDLVDGIATNGNNIRLWEVNGADAQKWAINKK